MILPGRLGLAYVQIQYLVADSLCPAANLARLSPSRSFPRIGRPETAVHTHVHELPELLMPVIKSLQVHMTRK